MNERRELRPIEEPAVLDASFKTVKLPIRPRNPEKQGDIDFVCPHCSYPLVVGTAGDVSDVGPVKCSACKKWSTGKDLKAKESR